MIGGAANGGEVGPETNLLLFTGGLASAGYAALTLIMGLTVAFRGADAGTSIAWRGIAIRAFGSWIAAIGLMVGGFALAPCPWAPLRLTQLGLSADAGSALF